MPVRRVPVLTDPDVAPDEVQIRAALGEAFNCWQGLESALTDPPFRLDLSWHYFRDGGWLRKALRGTRNLAWLAVWKDHATITFYFAARHREELVALPIPDALRDQAAEAEMTGRMLPLVIEIRSEADVAAALEVLRYKLGPAGQVVRRRVRSIDPSLEAAPGPVAGERAIRVRENPEPQRN